MRKSYTMRFPLLEGVLKRLRGTERLSSIAPCSLGARSFSRPLRKAVFEFFLLVSMLAIVPQLEAKVTESAFGKMPDGTAIKLFTLRDGPIEVRIMTYGARIVSIAVPDRNGKVADVVLGYASLEPYLGPKDPYFGAIVGRYANRIANGEITVDGKTYHLSRNEGNNTLHGGKVGFSARVWNAHEIPHGVEMDLTSDNGDQGFPGTVHVRVRYTLEGHSLKIHYFASTDQDTVINLTNHSYFNLAGAGEGTVLGELLTIPADSFTPVNAQQIPTGKIEPVAGTPFDFRKPTPIGARIHDNDEQLKYGFDGYDLNWVLNGKQGEMHEAARLVDPANGRVLTVSTTQPGVQVYTGNHLDGSIHGIDGRLYLKYGAIVFETQHFPDSPHHPNFPSTELKPGHPFESTTVFVFATER